MRHIAFDRLHNFRDIGGYPTADGTPVRWQRLYRSDSLGKLTGDDWVRFQSLGVRTVIDLRYPWEVERGGRVPDYDGLDYHNLSIEKQPYRQASLDPSIDPARMFADKNFEVAHEGATEIRMALDVIAAAPGPIVVHCSAGKDRTGLIVALVLGLLGVAEHDIIADYALTELATPRLIADYIAWTAHAAASSDAASSNAASSNAASSNAASSNAASSNAASSNAAGSDAAQSDAARSDAAGSDAGSSDAGKPLPIWPGYGHAPAEAMRLSLAELAEVYGSLRDYAFSKLGVDDALIAALHRQLVQKPVD